MSSTSKAHALKTLTNVSGERGGDDVGNAANKRLKSCVRSMSTERARRILESSAADVKRHNKAILDAQKEVRELKKKLEAAQALVASSKQAKARVENECAEAKKMAKDDAELVLQKVKDAGGSWRCSEQLGREAMEDMMSLDDGDGANLLRAAELIRGLAKESVLKGALKALLAADAAESGEIRARAMRELCLPFLEGKVNPADYCGVWPVVASALDGACVDASAAECGAMYAKLCDKIVEMVKKMKDKNPVTAYGRYSAEEDKCPIIDFLLPTYNAIRSEGGNAAKSRLRKMMKAGLLLSVSQIDEPETAADHSMPAEAATAAKRGYRDLQRFLLSSTETSLRLNLTKAGRLSVHRLIDNHMPHGKLRHESEGFGRGRVLVVTKVNATPVAMVEKRLERKAAHAKILDEHFCKTFVLSLPHPDVKLGLTIVCNDGMNMPELKSVADGSSMHAQLPAEFHANCVLASLKSDATGLVRPRTSQDCVDWLSKAREGLATAGGKIEMTLLPLNDTPAV